MPSAQQQYSFGSLNQPQQQHYEYQPNRQGAGATQNETTAYLNSAALLAEAAKRASIQVVMRDIEEMEL
ncbi:hypothetical protein SLS61_001930 [Didymella pomorum]